MATPPSRLLIDFARIGDLVIMVPLLRRLAEAGPLDLLTRPFGLPLFAGQTFLRSVHTLAHPNRGAHGIARRLLSGHRKRLGHDLGGRGYDEILVLAEERPVIRRWVEGWRGEGVVRVVDYPHAGADRLQRGFASLGLGVPGDTVPVLEVSDVERERARQRVAPLGGRVVAIQVGSSPASAPWRRKRNLKSLTTAQWAPFLADVLEGGADGLVFTGVPTETRYVRPIMAALPSRVRARVHDWTGSTTLSELRGLLTAFHALISVDTGTAHIAAAVGCPVLTLFGPSDPGAYAPRGSGPVETVTGSAPCQFCLGTPAFKQCQDNICMQSLSDSQLVRAWTQLAERIQRSEAEQPRTRP